MIQSSVKGQTRFLTSVCQMTVQKGLRTGLYGGEEDGMGGGGEVGGYEKQRGMPGMSGKSDACSMLEELRLRTQHGCDYPPPTHTQSSQHHHFPQSFAHMCQLPTTNMLECSLNRAEESFPEI